MGKKVFKTLDSRQERTVTHEEQEINDVNHTTAPASHLERILGRETQVRPGR